MVFSPQRYYILNSLPVDFYFTFTIIFYFMDRLWVGSRYDFRWSGRVRPEYWTRVQLWTFILVRILSISHLLLSSYIKMSFSVNFYRFIVITVCLPE